MRKLHKQQLLELTETLNTACCQLKAQKGETFFSLCAEIQDFVSEIFTYAENSLKDAAWLTEYLNDIYEMLYHVSQRAIPVEQVLGKIREMETSLNNAAPNKIEIAFLCYKASMSDSLESIYFAAKEDANCDAYFIPIPYFDRNEDGSVGQMHLEGVGHYSEQYELTDWRTYDIETRHPDVIFIMNPYDGRNLVTTVHPNFYSSRLREHTDMLVYIEYGLPYWLYRDLCAPDAEAEYRRSGLVLPAHVYSHYGITYSKELAEGYLPLFSMHPKIVQRWDMTPERIKEKFVPLGSSKFDKILNYGKTDYELPKDWHDKIEGKKVVLYNTGLSEFLKSTTQQTESTGSCLPRECWYFKKLSAIMEAFGDRDDVILWWRPHPLFETTVHSLRPALCEEYQRIVCEFKERNKGIFDDTEDLHRAIAWSDGMISDESSLLLLYAATGKPFYIPSITKALPFPVYDDGKDFSTPLEARLVNMRGNKGANVGDWNCCIWWDNFLEEDVMRNRHFNCYEERFIDFIVHRESYTEAEEYRLLQLQMVQDFVVNADGTAGQKIYEFVKRKI